MTAARRERKVRPSTPLLRSAGAFIALWAGFGLAATPMRAATTEMVVTNRHTGLAVDGYDPVAYFTEAAPKSGRAELEARVGGATWRFANEGNRAAFAAAPDVYMPRFGGYDPIALARGAAAAGHPELWLVVGQRLYLFYSEAAREAFAADPEDAIEAAERHWPEVQRTLAR
jgi:YHS domain-containing protein